MELRRQLGIGDATMLGLGSILGTGVFVSIGLVVGLSGAWSVVVVLAAALVAACNALSSAQLAAAFPRSGGTYEYGYRLLNPLAGFTAGWMFLCAKGASAATAALGLAGYVLHVTGAPGPEAHAWLAAGLIIVLTVLVASGLRRSNTTNLVVVSFTIAVLVAFSVAGAGPAVGHWQVMPKELPPAPDFLEAIALMFVAYAGYGRVATLGEEVRDPKKTIPRAIVTTLLASAAIYLAVAAVSVGVVDDARLAAATDTQGAPLELVAQAFGVPFLPLLIALGAITAMVGVLINLLLGLSRVLFAMGRRGDMPDVVTRVDQRHASPYIAVLVVGAIILGLALIGSIRVAWSFSAFTVLIYYALTNLAALRLPPAERLYPRGWSIGGLIACTGLAFFVEPVIWMVGVGIIVVGWVWHLAARRARSA